jgi:hypothetical protein
VYHRSTFTIFSVFPTALQPRRQTIAIEMIDLPHLAGHTVSALFSLLQAICVPIEPFLLPDNCSSFQVTHRCARTRNLRFYVLFYVPLYLQTFPRASEEYQCILFPVQSTCSAHSFLLVSIHSKVESIARQAHKNKSRHRVLCSVFSRLWRGKWCVALESS